MSDAILTQAKQRMDKSLEALQAALAKIRSGRAHPSLLDQVQVSCYGSEMPLKQVATVTVEDARTLAVSPFDKSMMQAIEKAIMTSDLGLNPATQGSVIRVPLPALTEERRKEMVKIAKSEAENAKVSIRNARRDANSEIKAAKVSTDEERVAQDKVQKLTDQAVSEADKLYAQKEQDLQL